MKTVVLLPSAGSMKAFDRPRALLSLGKETVIERLVRQSLQNEAVPLVARGYVGPWGWTKEHVAEFERLPCEVLVSPRHNTKCDLPTIRFLLQNIRAAEAKILVLAGDYVFSEDLFREVLQYEAPGFMQFSNRGAIGAALGTNDVPTFLIHTRGACLLWDVASSRGEWFQSALGYRSMQGKAAFFPQDFVEIDTPEEYELALLLVKERG